MDVRDDAPMREEIEQGFFPRFEDGWRKTEIIGLMVMLAFVLANIFGLLGKGLLSEWHVANNDDTVAADYEPVVRFGAPTKVTIHTKVPEGGHIVAMTMSADLADAFGLERITPVPSTWQAGEKGIRLVFPVREGEKEVLVRFSGSPSFRGRLDSWARLDKGETISWSQYSVP